MGVRTRCMLRNVKLSRANMRKAFDVAIQKEMHNAAREWLLTVYPLVPVWTGMARGSLISLGEFLHVPIPIVKAESAQKSFPYRGYWDGVPLGHFEFKFTATQFRFHYSTDVEHFADNEQFTAPAFYHLIEPTPWHSFQAGHDAFVAYVTGTLLPNLPKITKYIIPDEVYHR
jgi:hypothetical protein